MRPRRIAWLFAAAVLAAPASAHGQDFAFSPVAGSPFDMNSDPGDVIVADIDGDTFPDAVLGDAFGSTVTIFWGQSGGTFGSANETELITTGAADHLVVADLDNDIDLDIAGAGLNLQIFKRDNATPRSFAAEAAQTLDTEDDLDFLRADGMVAGNFDGGLDTDLDLAVSGSVASSGGPSGAAVRIFENDPTGTFVHDSNVYKATSRFAGEIVVGKFDADNDPDLAFLRSHDDLANDQIFISVRRGGAGLSFPTESTILRDFGAELAATDLDGDTNVDLVHNGSVDVFWGNGDGTFDAADEISDVAFPAEFFFGDFNNDGSRDVGLSGSTLTILTNQGSHNFAVGATYEGREEDFGFFGAAADLGGDPRDDLLIGTFLYFCAYLTVDALPAPAPGRCGPPAEEPPPGGGGDPPPGDDPPPSPPASPPSNPISAPPFNPPLTQPVVPVRANQIATLPSNRKCVSRRNFRIRLRRPPAGVTVSNATVLVNGRKVKTVRGARLTAPVDLRGIPKGKVTVTIRIVLSDGRVLRGKRVYRTCATKKRGSKRFPRSRG